MADHAAARALAFSLNQGDIDIHGHIDALLVETRTGEVVKPLAEIPLSKAGWFG